MQRMWFVRGTMRVVWNTSRDVNKTAVARQHKMPPHVRASIQHARGLHEVTLVKCSYKWWLLPKTIFFEKGDVVVNLTKQTGLHSCVMQEILRLSNIVFLSVQATFFLKWWAVCLASVYSFLNAFVSMLYSLPELNSFPRNRLVCVASQGSIDEGCSYVKVTEFVTRIKNLCTPDHVYLCNGSKEEYDHLMDLLVKQGSRYKFFWLT